jgi:hypothetical protein
LGVIFDGFSIPYGKSIDSSTEKQINAEKSTAREIIALLPKNITTYNLIGSSLAESIAWSDAILFYISHHGALQHKVAWITNKPGIVHTNLQILREEGEFPQQPAFWARQGGFPPRYINDSVVVDSRPENLRAKWKEGFDLNNYDFDWQILADEALRLCDSLIE